MLGGGDKKGRKTLDITACNYNSERLNIQVDSSQIICDNRILTRKPRKPNHSLCSDVLRTIRTWSTDAKFYYFARHFQLRKNKQTNRKLSVCLLSCQQPPIWTYLEPSSFFTIKLSYSLPAFEPLSNSVVVVDSLAIVITEEMASVCSQWVGLLKFPQQIWV